MEERYLKDEFDDKDVVYEIRYENDIVIKYNDKNPKGVIIFPSEFMGSEEKNHCFAITEKEFKQIIKKHGWKEKRHRYYTNWYKFNKTDNVWWCETATAACDDGFYFSFDKKDRIFWLDDKEISKLTPQQIKLLEEDGGFRCETIVDTWKSIKKKQGEK